MNEEYKAELDFDQLREWCAFCEGSREFPDECGSILMGVFLEGLTPEVDRFLREFSSYFPPALYENLVRVCGPALPDRDVLPWVQRDLNEMRKLFGSSSRFRKIRKLIDSRHFIFTHDLHDLYEVRGASAFQSLLYDTLGDYVIEKCDGDERLLALRETLYKGVNTSYFVADSIMAPLLQTEIDLSNYFEIYLRGGDYSLGDDGIVVYTHT